MSASHFSEQCHALRFRASDRDLGLTGAREAIGKVADAYGWQIVATSEPWGILNDLTRDVIRVAVHMATAKTPETDWETPPTSRRWDWLASPGGDLSDAVPLALLRVAFGRRLYAIRNGYVPQTWERADMTQDEIAGIADAVTKQLMNGPLRTMIREEVDQALGDIKEIVSTTDSKIDTLHGWMKRQDERITDLGTAKD